MRIRRFSRRLFELRLQLEAYARRLGLEPSALSYFRKWLLVGIAMGFAGGAAGIFFTFILDAMKFLFSILPWSPLIPALGGLASGLLVYSLAPEAEGHGTDAVINAVHRGWGRIRARVPLVKSIASAATIASGGSAGKEGPIAQVAAGVGSLISGPLGLNVHDRRLLLIAGVAAGIGAVFKAPLGAAIFAVEVLYSRDLEVEALTPAIIASVISYSVYSTVYGWEPVLTKPVQVFLGPLELVFIAVLGVIGGLTAIIYSTVFYGVRDLFHKIPLLANHAKPAIGGLAVGALGLFYPHVLGGGYETMNAMLNGEIADVWLLLALVIAKITATSMTIGSGGSGGVFAPSLFVGSALGSMMGWFFEYLTPEAVASPEAYALIGMAALFAGAAKVPLASIVIVSEMTRGYNLLVPATLAAAIAYLISGRKGLYESQLPARSDLRG